MQVSFGSGHLFGIRQDTALATPLYMGIMQNIDIEFSGDLKELFGSRQFAEELARGKSKITGKAKFGRLSAAIWNDLYFGQTMSAGQNLVALREAGTVPASSAYTITVANGASFTIDMGVIYAATALPLKLVASSPTQGQYTVSGAGVYTFAAADANANLLFFYGYTGTGGYTVVLTNQDMGSVPIWKGIFTTKFRNKSVTLILNACGSSKLSFPTKQDDYVVTEIDFTAKADDAGSIGSLSVAE